MVEFIVKAGLLLELLESAEAKGKNHKGDNVSYNKNCLLEVKEKIIEVKTVDEGEILIMLGKITDVVVKETGEIPIEFVDDNKKDGKFVPKLKRYGKEDDITVSYDGELIEVIRKKPRLRTTSPTIDIEDVKTHLSAHPFTYLEKEDIWKTKKTTFDTKIEINASEFKEVCKDGETIKYRSYPFEVKKDSVIVIVEDRDTGELFDRELKTEKIKAKDTITSLYSYAFGNVFENLSGKIEIWITNGMPMIIRKSDKRHEIVYILSSSELEEEPEQPIESESKDTITMSADQIEIPEDEPVEEDETIDMDEDEYNDSGICQDCGNEKDNINPSTGCCWECDLEAEEELKTMEEKAKPQDEPDMSWKKMDLVKYAKGIGISVESKDTKEIILEKIENREK